jgi:hypothetical protein
MPQLSDSDSSQTDNNLIAVVRDVLAPPPQREGLPANFRMRADAHYVDALDHPSPVTKAVTPAASLGVTPTPPTAATPLVRAARGTATAIIDTAVDEALRGISSAAALGASPSAGVRTGAAEIVLVETERALRLLSLARVLRGECPFYRGPVRLHALLSRLAQAMDRENAMLRAPHTTTVAADGQLTVDGSEELLLTAAYGIATVLNMVLPAGAPRTLRLTATVDPQAMLVRIELRALGLAMPSAWLHAALDEPWPIAGGALAHALLRAAAIVAESHHGSFSTDATGEGTAVRLSLPLDSSA